MRYSTIVEKDDKTLLEIIDALNQFEKDRFIAGIQARHYTKFQIDRSTIFIIFEEILLLFNPQIVQAYENRMWP